MTRTTIEGWRRLGLWLVVAVAAFALLAACGGDDDDDGADGGGVVATAEDGDDDGGVEVSGEELEITILMLDNVFEPSEIAIPAGTKVKFLYDN